MLHRSLLLGALAICAPLLLSSTTRAVVIVTPQAYYWDDYNHNLIYRTTTPGGPSQVIYSGGTGASGIQPTAMAIDQQNRFLYWGDDNASNPARILRSNLDGSNVTTILSDPVPNGSGPSFVEGLELDTQHNWIYFTDQSDRSVRRVHLDGTGEQQIISASVNGAFDIAFDFAHNRMFWDEIHSTVSVIMTANLDGTASHQVFTDPGFYYGLELDPTGQYLYFTDQDPDFGRVGIRRINVNGTNPIVLIPQPTGSWPQGMDLDPFNNKLYWVVHNTDTPAVFRANLDGSGIEMIANATNMSDPPALWDVAVLYPPGVVPEPACAATATLMLAASLTRRRMRGPMRTTRGELN